MNTKDHTELRNVNNFLLDDNNWKSVARSSQRTPEGNWRIWAVIAGRGFGKTRTGAETIREWAISGKKKQIAIIGPSMDDIRNIMIEGSSGLLSISCASDGIKYIPSKNIIKWANGTKAYLVSAYNPQKIRGLQFDGAWIDEFVKLRNPRSLWMQLTFSLRLGDNPQVVITSTPAINQTLSKILSYDSCVQTGGTTYENADNLSPEFLSFIKSEYGDTIIEKQEILGEMISEDIFWSDDDIKYENPKKCNHNSCYCNFDQLVLGVDPSVNGYYTETGIILAGVQGKKIYVLQDLSCNGGVDEWLSCVKKVCIDYNIKNIAIETNQGGNMLEYIIQNHIPKVNIHKYFAKSGKESRARVLASLYKRKEVFHSTKMEMLEKQMKNYHKVEKKDRVDGLIWAVYHLLRHYNTKTRKVHVISQRENYYL